jgi:predicted hydrocarbon binding protein
MKLATIEMKSKAKARPAQPMTGMFLDEKRGTLNAYGARFLLIPVNLIHSMEDRLSKSLGPVTATSFEYEIGKEGGAQFASLALKAGLDINSRTGIQQVANSLGAQSGWGKIEVVEFDFGKHLARIRWKNGVSVRNRKGKTPVCHFGRGILTGAVEEILGRKCESIEVTCQGKGDPFCEAVVGDPREITRVADTIR